MNARHIAKKIRVLPKRLRPFTPWSILFAGLVVASAGTSAIVIQQINDTTGQTPTTSSIPNKQPVDPKSVTTQDTPTPSKNEQKTNQQQPSKTDRCLKLHNEQLSDDIDNFRRDNEFLRKNLAAVDVNANLLTVAENNELKNKYIKYYNDSRSGSVGVYRQTMTNNGCSAYIKEPSPGYVDYY